jgi:hypothetical protein
MVARVGLGHVTVDGDYGPSVDLPVRGPADVDFIDIQGVAREERDQDVFGRGSDLFQDGLRLQDGRAA